MGPFHQVPCIQTGCVLQKTGVAWVSVLSGDGKRSYLLGAFPEEEEQFRLEYKRSVFSRVRGAGGIQQFINRLVAELYAMGMILSATASGSSVVGLFPIFARLTAKEE